MPSRTEAGTDDIICCRNFRNIGQLSSESKSESVKGIESRLQTTGKPGEISVSQQFSVAF